MEMALNIDGNKSSLPACRLCAGPVIHKFSLPLFNGNRVCEYYHCQHCGSLQTEQPDWLEQAYGIGNLSLLDTGAALRVLRIVDILWALCRYLFQQSKPVRLLDFGGGDGLLCRLLRDRGIDAYTFDTYARASYAAGFEAELGSGFDVISACEVWEHFDNPAKSIEKIFAQSPKAVFVTTELYEDQGVDWWYLTPETGQHLFFYSRRALQKIAENYNYNIIFGRGYHLFIQSKPSFWDKKVIGKFLSARRAEKLARWCGAVSYRYAQEDYEKLKQSIRDQK